MFQEFKRVFPFFISGVTIIILLFACRNDTVPPSETYMSLAGKSNQELLEECLNIQVLDKTFQWDGKVMVSYTNICSSHAFRLTKTGLKYKKGDKTEYLTKDTPLMLGKNSTETLELSIPFGIKPRVAYTLKDDAKAILAH